MSIAMSPLIDETHDAAARSWVETADGHRDFPVQNLPFGIFSAPGHAPRGGVAIGESIVDLAALAGSGLLAGAAQQAAVAASAPTLNGLLAVGSVPRRALRRSLFRLLTSDGNRNAVERMLVGADSVTLHVPARIGGYTDFYAGIHHAINVGKLFRPTSPLLPNYKYVPIGYHGRASSIRLSGMAVKRPKGQRKHPSRDEPVFGPTERLDFELELGLWIGPGNRLGAPIPIASAAEHVAGLCLLNDWSARDLQAWEYQPLGPFLAKSFMTSISPWIITAEALAPFRVPQAARPEGDPEPLAYLFDDEDRRAGAYAIDFEVFIQTAQMRAQGLAPFGLSKTSATNLYWTVAQLVTHHTSNGCNLEPGDLLGTGTISSPDPSGYGSLIEITGNGARPVSLPSGETRGFLKDGDGITFSATARAKGRVPIGFGPCHALIEPGTAY
jgi:fumarylacetoacetase